MSSTLSLYPLGQLLEDGKSEKAARSSGATIGGQTGSQVVNSDDLLRGSRTIAIAHKGALYRLQETKLGKLILTK